jgi:hypothetical protein
VSAAAFTSGEQQTAHGSVRAKLALVARRRGGRGRMLHQGVDGGRGSCAGWPQQHREHGQGQHAAVPSPNPVQQGSDAGAFLAPSIRHGRSRARSGLESDRRTSRTARSGTCSPEVQQATILCPAPDRPARRRLGAVLYGAPTQRITTSDRDGRPSAAGPLRRHRRQVAHRRGDAPDHARPERRRDGAHRRGNAHRPSLRHVARHAAVKGRMAAKPQVGFLGCARMRARPVGPAQSSALHDFAQSGPTKEAHRRALNRSGGLQRLTSANGPRPGSPGTRVVWVPIRVGIQVPIRVGIRVVVRVLISVPSNPIKQFPHRCLRAARE